MIVVQVHMMLMMVVVVVLMMIMMMISRSSSYHHDCGTGPCGHLCRANSIRDTVPSRESHVLNEPTFTFYLHFLFSKLPFTSHKNLCCFFCVTSPTSTQLLAKDFASGQVGQVGQVSAETQNEQLDFLGHNMHIMSLIIRKLDRNACQQIGVRNMFHQENVGNLAIASSWKGWAGPLIITKQSQNPDHGLESGKPLFCNGSTSRKRNWSAFYTTGGK